jgi:hypothetical protein
MSGIELWKAVPANPGDIDLDGEVDFQDFLILQINFGATSGAERSDGDLDGDGDVDFVDFMIFQPNFGASTDTASADVASEQAAGLADSPIAAQRATDVVLANVMLDPLVGLPASDALSRRSPRSIADADRNIEPAPLVKKRDRAASTATGLDEDASTAAALARELESSAVPTGRPIHREAVDTVLADFLFDVVAPAFEI